jgi:hypothetical protein
MLDLGLPSPQSSPSGRGSRDAAGAGTSKGEMLRRDLHFVGMTFGSVLRSLSTRLRSSLLEKRERQNR